MQLTIKKVSKPDQKSNHIHLITAQKFPSGIDAQAKKAIKTGLDSGLKVVNFIDNGEVVRAYVCEGNLLLQHKRKRCETLVTSCFRMSWD